MNSSVFSVVTTTANELLNSPKNKTIKKGIKGHSFRSPPQDGLENTPTPPIPPTPTPTDKLGEDELCLIFSNLCITISDLFNFRLVSKNWRDAGASVLLRRDACYIPLDEKRQPDKANNTDSVMSSSDESDQSDGSTKSDEAVGSDDKSVKSDDESYTPDDESDESDKSFESNATAGWGKNDDKASHHFVQRGNKNEISALVELTHLMSKSSKFPASNLHIKIDAKYLDNDTEYYSFYPDVLQFFQLHGHKIRTLCPRRYISPHALHHILSTFTPNIDCLNLKNASFPLRKCWNSNKLKNKTENNEPKKCTTLKSLILGNYPDSSTEQTLSLLLPTSPKLCLIENADMNTMGVILKEGMGHLVRSFYYDSNYDYMSCGTTTTTNAISTLEKFSRLQPQLSKLTLGALLSCSQNVTSINAILESSKDTLQQLSLSNCGNESQTKLRIAHQMPNLKTIIWTGTQTGTEERVIRNGLDFIFQDGKLASKYFPNLVNFHLNYLVVRNIQDFFQFKLNSDGTDVTNSLQKVKMLDIYGSKIPKYYISKLCLMPKFFPNVQILKVNGKDFQNFESSIWLIFPCVELIEIYNISSVMYGREKLGLFADMFFTGFSLEIVQKLRKKNYSTFYDNNRLKIQRTSLSVCDLQHLKELKLQFSPEMEVKCASHVTGIYAFSQMPNTRFIISYDAAPFKNRRVWSNSKNKCMDKESLCFGSIKPYVQTVYEKQSPVDFE